MSNPLVFITGGTGFIGSHVALALRKAGYRVRLSIRDLKQEAVLRARYSEFGGSIEVSLVPDFSKQEYFDTALKNVDYVFHLASPMPSAGGNLKKDYIDPAVNGTLAVLRAANAYRQIKCFSLDSDYVSITGELTLAIPPILRQRGETLGITALASRMVRTPRLDQAARTGSRREYFRYRPPNSKVAL
ncbi:uncharacterized protein PFLUO_LOCUS38 [Penicillium psychrofluorescens]|uniref:uncharacterized protein n=1 Tax=Penicillium psychrofluorescens TaxID=3158075 RepID=UPI003CCD9F6A